LSRKKKGVLSWEKRKNGKSCFFNERTLTIRYRRKTTTYESEDMIVKRGKRGKKPLGKNGAGKDSA